MAPQRTRSKTATSSNPLSILVARVTKPVEVIDLSSDPDGEGASPAPTPSVSALQEQNTILREAKRKQHRKFTAEIRKLKQELKEKEQELKKGGAPRLNESLTRWKELYQDSETKRTLSEGQYEEAKKTVAELEKRLEEQRKKLEEGDTATHLEIIHVLEGDLAAERENVQRYANAYAMHKAAHDKLKAHAEGMWRDLECPMCFEITWEPMVLNCGHVFCAGCTRQLTRCGSCRAPIRYPAVPCYPLKQMTRAIGQIAAPQEHSPRRRP